MTTESGAELEVLADSEALAHRAADWLHRLAAAKDGNFAIALSGGSTPRRLYRLLAGPPYAETFPWQRAHWFWGDERFVPHDHPDSNYRMACEALLSHAPVPAGNVHAIPTTGQPPAEAAAAYQRTLEEFYGAARLDAARPLFDVMLLGLGTDGHTASLFPGNPVLKERERWVAPVADAASHPRITLTYPALESSRHAAYLVAGEGKREAFRRLRRRDPDIPAARVRPVGMLHLFADEAAAGQ